ncbi:copper-binding protein (plasmid) [Burkholderia thailandensis]|uniref:copper-binding protein n=1 Tax=Burkholderia thailandensis TaxID=57975 RepID=UPI00192D96BA|nr:copper-binding protein [Burkholderia thailandensis]MBS2132239.1 copper-binding protein [Burkholderia thailandensis]QRA15332.1 copper-binding protein [Burkholderia thailandensis]
MKQLMTLSVACCVAISLTGVALAGESGAMKMEAGSMKAQASTSALTNAVVKKVDTASGMITINHGELANIGMAPMTMAYKAKDAGMLKAAKAGEKVKVRVENVNGTLTIVRLEKR